MRIVAEGGDKENASRRGGGLAASTSYVPEKDAGQQNAPTAAFSHKRTLFAPRAGGDVKVRRRLSNGWRRELRFSTLSLSLSLSHTHTHALASLPLSSSSPKTQAVSRLLHGGSGGRGETGEQAREKRRRGQRSRS
jgi:hypothetical protein